MTLVIGTILAFLSIVGLAEICRAAGDFLLRPSKGRAAYMIALSGHEEQAEYIIRSLVFRARSCSFFQSKPLVIVIDKGMDEETLSICSMLSSELDCVEICGGEDCGAKYL